MMDLDNEITYKILVVDDNPENIKMIGSVLLEMNYLMGFATNGKQAMELLNNNPDYDLVLLDINMPLMDGYETCKTIRKDARFADLPIIFLTANAHNEQLIQGLDAGAQDYIVKPFNTKELLARVNVQLELKLKADQVKRYAAELAKLNATKDRFFSLIAHDLRNPFAGLVMSSSALLKQIRKIEISEVEEFLQEFNQTARRGLDLVENLLDWSKSQRDMLTVCSKDEPLKQIVDDCVALIIIQAQAKRIRISNEIPEGLIVHTDKNIMKTILRNLLSNAVKFTHESGTVRITALEVDQMLQVSVIDTGIGIPEEIMANLFRIDKEACTRLGTLNETGSGLGLIICNDLMVCLGGKMRVESREGAGCAVHLTIPGKLSR